MSHDLEATVNLIRGVMAGLLLVVFAGLWLWVYGAKRRSSFESASRLPLEEDGRGEQRR